MSQIFKKLITNMAGDLSVNGEDLDYYSTDGGIFELTPSAIVFPNDANDMVELVKTVAEYNSQGVNPVSLTARGNGTDQGGGPINTGIIVDVMRHMNHILEIGEDYVLVEPGCLYGRMQDELKKRGRYIPSYPASIEICTIGGAVANNSAGEKTVKYGATRNYVEAVQVVLADGSLTWVYNVTGNELDEKKALPGLEGKIYQQISELIDSNYDVVMNNHPHTTKESAGYALWEVTGENGSLNLAQLITGSQGTLCMITAIRLRTVPVPAPHEVVLAVSYYDSLEHMGQAVQELAKLNPSALEIVDRNLLELVNKHKPELLQGLLPENMPEVVLLTEFDDSEQELRDKNLESAIEIFAKYSTGHKIKHDQSEQTQLWKLRRSAAAVMWTIPGTKKALPIIEDGTVPPEKLVEFIKRAYEIFEKFDLEVAIWGHAGDADLHMQPFMDLGLESDRQKIFDVTDAFYAMVHELGGTAAGEHNDSLIRAPYRPLMFGPEMEALFNQVKHIFDSENLFNPHKKVGVDFNYIKQHIRHEYSIKSIAHLERDQAQQAVDR